MNKSEVQYLVDLYIKNIEGFEVIKDLVRYVYAIRLQNRIDLASVYFDNNNEIGTFVDSLYLNFFGQTQAVEWYARQGLKSVL